MTQFLCSSCGYGSASWYGRCPSCGEWNTMMRQADEQQQEEVRQALFTPLAQVPSLAVNRTKTGMFEFDRVLGGGFVHSSVILLAGEPGVGKSTLLLKALSSLRTMYVSGEESGEQIKERAGRISVLGAPLYFSDQVQVEGIIKSLTEKIKTFDIVVIDSIQTVYSKDIPASVASVAQIKAIASLFIDFAKKNKKAVVLVGHITKEGDIAGPKTLEHLVDCVLHFEGDRSSQFRILRAYKNRFGSTDEVGIFEMKKEGLHEVSNATVFLDTKYESKIGKAIVGLMEGARPIFFEIESLVVESVLAIPRRVTSGIDYNKLLLLLAVIRKNLHISLDHHDIYLNVVGGVAVKSTAADCGIVASLISSIKNINITSKSLFIGEVGLLGEVKKTIREEVIIKEAGRFGFSPIYSSKNISSVTELAALLLRKK